MRMRVHKSRCNPSWHIFYHNVNLVLWKSLDIMGPEKIVITAYNLHYGGTIDDIFISLFWFYSDRKNQLDKFNKLLTLFDLTCSSLCSALVWPMLLSSTLSWCSWSCKAGHTECVSAIPWSWLDRMGILSWISLVLNAFNAIEVSYTGG